MLRIFAKDLLAARWFLLAGAGALFLYTLQPFFSAGVILAAGAAVVLFGLAVVFFLEDRNRTEIVTLSLPVKRSEVVGARHLLGVLFLAVSGGIVFGAIAPLGTLVHSGPAAAGLFRLFSIEAAALFFVITAFLLALYLPLVHRFGFGRGTVLFLVAAIVLASLGAAAWFARLPADFSKSGGFESVFQALRALRSSLGTPLFLLLAAALIVVPYSVSFRLSLRFYARREF